jgi:PAS domain S-box-containing protein
MFAGRERPKQRPSYPSPTRQWFGILLSGFLVVGLDFAIRNGLQVHDPGGLYLLLVIFVTHWSGLRAGIIGTAIILAYLTIVSWIPGSAFQHTPWEQRHVPGLSIVLSFFAIVIGTVQGRIRNAEIKQWDAWAASEQETSQRRQAEAALLSSEDMWRLVVSASMDGIIVAAENGTISLWNQNAESMFGWTADEVLGQKLDETIIPPSLREAHRSGLQRYLETGESHILGQRLELLGFTKDGREFPIELTVVPHHSGNARAFIGFVRDISENKKLNDRLRQAQRMEAIGRLAGGIAHDFNNIIAAIAGNTALARADAPSDHAIQECLAEIEKAVARATHVVAQIMSFSRNQTSKPTLVEVEPTLLDAINLLRATIPANIQIETRFGPEMPPVLAEPADFHQIILNLGINAAHAMRGSGGRFNVEAIELELDEDTASKLLRVSAGHYVRIAVGDTGCGMDSQTLQRLFEPFFTTKAVGEGTGLGLSVVYGIVERLGGAITVYSEPDKGSVFHIYLPVAEGVTAVSETPARHTLSGKAERILYVDDDEALVFMMTRMLRRLNYEVLGFEHPGEALEAIQAAPDRFDVLITDMSMPHMDGPEFVLRVREIRPDMPVVMVTGYIRPEDTERAKALGIDHLVLKPNTVHEMSEVLSGILGKEASALSQD